MTDEVYKLLTAPRKTKYRIEQIKSKIIALRYTLMPSAIRHDMDKVQTSPIDALPDRMAQISELEDKLMEMNQIYQIEINDIIKACNEMGKEPEKTILMMQYVGGLSVIPIAGRLNYSVSYTYKLRSNGYDLLNKTIVKGRKRE